MMSCFNSIKVQLEHHRQHEKTRGFALFQFHKGAIRTCRPFSEPDVVEFLFQFHKGAIRTCYVVIVGNDFLSFNSIKVQLERRGDAKTAGYFACFNSIKVQLEREKEGVSSTQFHVVSIP